MYIVEGIAKSMSIYIGRWWHIIAKRKWNIELSIYSMILILRSINFHLFLFLFLCIDRVCKRKFIFIHCLHILNTAIDSLKCWTACDKIRARKERQSITGTIPWTIMPPYITLHIPIGTYQYHDDYHHHHNAHIVVYIIHI